MTETVGLVAWRPEYVPRGTKQMCEGEAGERHM